VLAAFFVAGISTTRKFFCVMRGRYALKILWRTRECATHIKIAFRKAVTLS
jgi:hypothetical protein